MRKHLKRSHVDKKPIVKIPQKTLECNYCDAKFTDKDKLEDHISNHSDVEKYTCHLCNKHYTCMKSLKLHLVHHERRRKLAENEEFVVDTGDFTLEEWNDFIKQRVSVCPKCNKDYHTPRNMRKHLRRVHTSERKYGCEVCGKMLKSIKVNSMKASIRFKSDWSLQRVGNLLKIPVVDHYDWYQPQ
uniref:Zinc finger and BTB domain-containing protein 49 n=1 Tax=Cacopsylla melanoneura TaxID=428564 RepID=A0A8D9DWG3_9HEMI